MLRTNISLGFLLQVKLNVVFSLKNYGLNLKYCKLYQRPEANIDSTASVSQNILLKVTFTSGQ